MNIQKVLELVVKGAGVAEALFSAGKDALPAIKVVAKLATGAQDGPITEAELTETEATLDAMIADFNEPM